MNRNLYNDFRFILSMIGYILIVYPFKRFIHPVLMWIFDNFYLICAFGVALMALYIFDFNVGRFSNAFTEKVIGSNLEQAKFILRPFITIGPFGVSPADLILGVGFASVIVKLYQLFRIMFNQIKIITGDFLLVFLWSYFKLVGNEEGSMMLISKDEAKNKIAMYVIIIILILLIFITQVLPLMLFSPADFSEPIVINGTNISIEQFKWVI